MPPRKRNVEADRAYKRRRYAENAEQFRVEARERRTNNPEASRSATKRWKAKNPDRVRLMKRDQNHRRKALVSSSDDDTRTFIEILLHDPCAYCGKPSETVDHIVPLSEFGEHHWSNLAGACGSCNSRKRTMPLLTFLLRGNIGGESTYIDQLGSGDWTFATPTPQVESEAAA